jgi:membrane protease subunit HflK
MYTDAMQQIYSSVSKVMVESRQGSNLLYLPLDKLMQVTGPAGAAPDAGLAPVMPPGGAAPPAAGADPRTRDSARTRDRDGR